MQICLLQNTVFLLVNSVMMWGYFTKLVYLNNINWILPNQDFVLYYLWYQLSGGKGPDLLEAQPFIELKMGILDAWIKYVSPQSIGFPVGTIHSMSIALCIQLILEHFSHNSARSYLYVCKTLNTEFLSSTSLLHRLS